MNILTKIRWGFTLVFFFVFIIQFITTQIGLPQPFELMKNMGGRIGDLLNLLFYYLAKISDITRLWYWLVEKFWNLVEYLGPVWDALADAWFKTWGGFYLLLIDPWFDGVSGYFKYYTDVNMDFISGFWTLSTTGFYILCGLICVSLFLEFIGIFNKSDKYRPTKYLRRFWKHVCSMVFKTKKNTIQVSPSNTVEVVELVPKSSRTTRSQTKKD